MLVFYPVPDGGRACTEDLVDAIHGNAPVHVHGHQTTPPRRNCPTGARCIRLLPSPKAVKVAGVHQEKSNLWSTNNHVLAPFS